MVPLGKGLQWVNVKQNSDRFRYILGIIQEYSRTFRTLRNPDIFRTVVYSMAL